MSGVITATVGAAVVGGMVQNSASKRSARATEQASEQGIAQIERATRQAKADIEHNFPIAQRNVLAGAQAAGDTIAHFAPEQMRAYAQGSTGAQEQLLAGLPLMNNAILGLPMDYSVLQASNYDIPENMFNFTMPDYNPVSDDPDGLSPSRVISGHYNGVGGNEIFKGGGYGTSPIAGIDYSKMFKRR